MASNSDGEEVAELFDGLQNTLDMGTELITLQFGDTTFVVHKALMEKSGFLKQTLAENPKIKTLRLRGLSRAVSTLIVGYIYHGYVADPKPVEAGKLPQQHSLLVKLCIVAERGSWAELYNAGMMKFMKALKDTDRDISPVDLAQINSYPGSIPVLKSFAKDYAMYLVKASTKNPREDTSGAYLMKELVEGSKNGSSNIASTSLPLPNVTTSSPAKNRGNAAPTIRAIETKAKTEINGSSTSLSFGNPSMPASKATSARSTTTLGTGLRAGLPNSSSKAFGTVFGTSSDRPSNNVFDKPFGDAFASSSAIGEMFAAKPQNGGVTASTNQSGGLLSRRRAQSVAPNASANSLNPTASSRGSFASSTQPKSAFASAFGSNDLTMSGNQSGNLTASKSVSPVSQSAVVRLATNSSLKTPISSSASAFGARPGNPYDFPASRDGLSESSDQSTMNLIKKLKGRVAELEATMEATMKAKSDKVKTTLDKKIVQTAQIMKAQLGGKPQNRLAQDSATWITNNAVLSSAGSARVPSRSLTDRPDSSSSSPFTRPTMQPPLKDAAIPTVAKNAEKTGTEDNAPIVSVTPAHSGSNLLGSTPVAKRKLVLGSDFASQAVSKKIKIEDHREGDHISNAMSSSNVGTAAITELPQAPQAPVLDCRRLCRNWLRDGNCRFGANCRYTHY